MKVAMNVVTVATVVVVLVITIDGNYPLVITPATVVITITPFFG